MTKTFNIFAWIRAVDSADLSTGARSLALALILRMNSTNGNVVKTKMNELATHLQRDQSTVKRWRKELENQCLLVGQRTQQGNLYLGQIPPSSKSQEGTDTQSDYASIPSPTMYQHTVPTGTDAPCDQSHDVPVPNPTVHQCLVPPVPPYKESTPFSTGIIGPSVPAHTHMREDSPDRPSVEPSTPLHVFGSSHSLGVDSSPSSPENLNPKPQPSKPQTTSANELLAQISERYRPRVFGRSPDPSVNADEFIERLEASRGEPCRTTLRSWLCAVVPYLSRDELDELLDVATTQMTVASRPFLKSVVERICTESRIETQAQTRAQKRSATQRTNTPQTSAKAPKSDLSKYFTPRVVDISAKDSKAVLEGEGSSHGEDES